MSAEVRDGEVGEVGAWKDDFSSLRLKLWVRSGVVEEGEEVGLLLLILLLLVLLLKDLWILSLLIER